MLHYHSGFRLYRSKRSGSEFVAQQDIPVEYTSRLQIDQPTSEFSLFFSTFTLAAAQSLLHADVLEKIAAISLPLEHESPRYLFASNMRELG